jgi:hypothetical protein
MLPTLFTVREARAEGVTSGRLHALDLVAPFHGTRSTRIPDALDRLRLLVRVLPAHAFACGPTAAALLGMPLPSRLEAAALAHPTIGVPHPANRIRRPGVQGRALRIDPSDLDRVAGIQCTNAARIWVDLSPLLPLPRLVAVADHLVHRERQQTSIADLAASHRRAGRSRGAVARTMALILVSDASESPRESELRVLLLQSGLPAPEVNVEIIHRGRFVARVDLLFRAERLIVEYDGDYHRDHGQWSKDQSRRAELESLGYRVTVVTSHDFEDPHALVRRIRRLLSSTPPLESPKHAG